MTRLELLKILVGQARSNGFEFRRWFTTCLSLPWQDADSAFGHLDRNRHYYALLFSHEFAETFWKTGQPITFEVPAQTFQRSMSNGSVGTVKRKSFIRRSGRPDAWKYHLREMALAPEPLRYIRKYIRVEGELDETEIPAPQPAVERPHEKPVIPATLALARKTHERRRLALETQGVAKPSKRAARPPGGRSKKS